MVPIPPPLRGKGKMEIRVEIGSASPFLEIERPWTAGARSATGELGQGVRQLPEKRKGDP